MYQEGGDQVVSHCVTWPGIQQAEESFHVYPWVGWLRCVQLGESRSDWHSHIRVPHCCSGQGE